MNILICGAGYMAGAYFSVLKKLGYEALVVGRSEAGCKRFEEEHHQVALRGGIETFLETNVSALPDTAIVATTPDQLATTTIALLKFGVRRILVEKPGALKHSDLMMMEELAVASGAEVYIAFNRRFYSSTLKAEELIQDDGGPLSFTFEFTELADRILSYEHPPGVLENWFYANSSHVLDLAFFLGGDPVQISAYTDRKLQWHPVGIYAGAGRTDKGALFSYHANWDSAGRWWVELCTNQRRLILRPLESLSVQERGQFSIEQIELDDQLDKDFKPGIFRQTRAFLSGEMKDRLLAIGEYVRRFHLFERINDSRV